MNKFILTLLLLLPLSANAQLLNAEKEYALAEFELYDAMGCMTNTYMGTLYSGYEDVSVTSLPSGNDETYWDAYRVGGAITDSRYIISDLIGSNGWGYMQDTWPQCYYDLFHPEKTAINQAHEANMRSAANTVSITALTSWVSSTEPSPTIPASNLSENVLILNLGAINTTNAKVNDLADAVQALVNTLVTRGLLE